MKILLFLPLFLIGSLWSMEENQFNNRFNKEKVLFQTNKNPTSYIALEEDNYYEQEMIQDNMFLRDRDKEEAEMCNRIGGCILGMVCMGSSMFVLFFPWLDKICGVYN